MSHVFERIFVRPDAGQEENERADFNWGRITGALSITRDKTCRMCCAIQHARLERSLINFGA